MILFHCLNHHFQVKEAVYMNVEDGDDDDGADGDDEKKMAVVLEEVPD